MRVLVAGATGTLGAPLVGALLARGHHVTGLARSQERLRAVREAGAETAEADALDADAVAATVKRAAPDAIVNALTALPKGAPRSTAEMAATNGLRIRGTANLLRAAREAGVRRIIGESMILAYGFGDHGRTPLTESAPPTDGLHDPGLQLAVNALRSLEDQMLQANAAGWIEAVPLRYGFFYGSGAPSTRVMLEAIRKRRQPVVWGAHGIVSWVHLDDAVAGTVAALEHGRPGEVYNIVDDRPASINEWTREAAKVLGAPRPLPAPLFLVRLMMPYVAAVVETVLPVSNVKAKSELGWGPRYRSIADGLQAEFLHPGEL